VADAHESYLQVAAEYGFVVLALYLALLAACGLMTVVSIVSRRTRMEIGWAGMGLIVGAAVIPLAALTNAHVINPRNGPLEWLLIGAATAVGLSVAERSAAAADRSATVPSGATTAPPG
jgi:hypothetical protein